MRWFQLSLCAVITCVCLCIAQTQKNTQLPKLSTSVLSNGIGNFSLILLYNTAKQLNDNLIMAPYTVWALMAALAEGAAGKTLDELMAHLRIKKSDRGNTRRYHAEISKYFVANTSLVSLERNSALFTDSSSPVDPSYAADLAKYYYTDVRTVDFKNIVHTAKLINDYVYKATHGKVDHVVYENDLTEATMVLTDIMYFKAQWTTPFNVSETTVQPFNDLNGREIGNVSMMFKRGVFPYANIPALEARVINLPYGNQHRLSLIVILPYPGVSLEQVLRNFKRVSLAEVFVKLDEAIVEYEDDEVECWIPRFKISTDVSVMEPLHKMGIHRIFDPLHADLPRISRQKVHVSRVFHKAEIEVTEEGTTAAAVTVAELANRMTASKFKANRPFLFFVAEKVTKLFVFGGVYRKPSVY